MKNDRINTGVEPILKSLTAVDEPQEWKLIRFVVAYIGWFLWFFVCVIYLVSPDVRARGPWILGWLLLCLAYLVVREVLSRTKEEFYETSLFRIVRIQVVVFLGSALLWMTDGAESYFWFIYLWPLVASALYFPWGVTWGIYGEVAVLYFLASLAAAGRLALINLASLLTNLAVLLVFTVVFRYLVENVRKYQATERKLRYSEVLRQIQEDIDSAIDLQEVLDKILRRAVELVGARDGSLMLMDEKGELRFRARFGRSLPEGKIERTFKLGEGIAGWVVQNVKPYICYDTEADAHFTSIIAGFPIRSLVSVPIISHGVVLGVINVDSAKPNRFSVTDVELLVPLADQVAVSIERAELLESLRQIGEKTLGGAEDLHQHIVDAVHRLTRCPVSMWRVDETGKQTRIVASRGISTEYAEKARLDLDRSVTGKAIRERKIIPVLDIQADPDFQNKEEAAEEGWQSMLVVPLLAGPERAVGTLSIYSMTKREEFTRWELDLLRAFAGQAGVAIQNAERLQMIQRLNEVGQSLATLQESPEVFQETLKQIADAAIEVLGADVVDLYQYQADRDDFVLPPIRVGERRFPHLIPTQISPDDVVVKIANTGEAIYTSDAQEHPLLAGDWEFPREERPKERFVVREEIISSAAVPMKVGEEVLGVMFASYRQRRDFDTDVELRERIEVLANQGAIAINNARLVQRLRDRADEVGLLQQVGAQISTALELDEILPSLVEGAMRLTKTESGVVHVLDSSGENVVGSYGYPKEFSHPSPRISEEGYTRFIIQKKEQQVVRDAQVDGRANPEIKEEGVRSFVGTPLKLEGKRVVGVLYVNDTSVRPFTERELSLLRALADQAAVAIEHAWLFQELEERATQLKRLQAVTATISAEPSNLERVSRLTVDSLSNIFHEASCAIRLYDSKADRFRPQMATGVMEDWIDHLPRPVGTSRYVVQTKSPRYLEGDDVASPSDEGPAVREDILALGIKAVAYLPLISRGDVVGILYVNLTVPHRFSQNDRLLLELFADQAAIAIENARLYQQRVQDISALMEINSVISSQDLDKVIQLIADKAVELIGADYCVLRLLDRSGQCLIPEASSGRESKKDPLLIDGSSFTGWVASQRQAELCSDVNQDEHYLKWYPDVQSCMAAPLMYREELVGTLYVESTRLNAFSQASQLALLQSFADQAAIAIENARLFEKMERHASELAALYETGREITSILGLDALLQSIAKRSALLTNADKGLILFVDMEAKKLTKTPAGWGFASDQIEGFTYQEVLDGISGWVLRKGEPTISEDILADPRNTGLAREKAEKEPDRGQSIAVAPLLIKDEVIGTLTVINNVGKPVFTNDDLDLVVMFANQAAIAIENARLYEQRSKDIAALQEVNAVITSASWTEIANLIARKAKELTQAEYSRLWIVEGNRLVLGATYGAEAREELPIDEHSINGWVAMTGENYGCSDVSDDPHYLEWREGIRSSMAVPLKFGEQVIGTLDAESAKLDAFSDYQLELLQSLADQAAIAIENARLYERLDRKIANLGAVSEVGQTLTSGISLSEEQILELVYEQATPLMDTSDMYIALYDEEEDIVSFGLAMDNDRRVDVGREEGWGSRKAGHGLTEYVIRTKQSFRPADVEKAYRTIAKDYIGKIPRSWMGVPMMVEDKVLGVVVLRNDEYENVYGEDDLEVLQAIAGQAAIAIQNARLVQQQERQIDELDALRQLAEELSAGVLPIA